jgi:DNA-directed RNA polymerase subunit RPC12/RpoP
MTRGTGIAIPCATCAAALPVDLRSRALRCPHCRTRNAIPKAHRAAAGVHLERLAVMARIADELASEGDYQRRRRRFQPGAVLAAIAPLLVAWWLIAGLAVGVGAMIEIFTLYPAVGNHPVAAPAVSLGAMLIWAGWVALLRRFLTRRRATIAALPATAADARCGRCGATVPVLIGHAMHCPFCAAALLPDRAAQQAAESRVEHHVMQLRAEAVVEAMRSEATRMPALENMIAMTTLCQLLTIGLSCVVSVIVIAIAVVNALRGAP